MTFLYYKMETKISVLSIAQNFLRTKWCRACERAPWHFQRWEGYEGKHLDLDEQKYTLSFPGMIFPSSIQFSHGRYVEFLSGGLKESLHFIFLSMFFTRDNFKVIADSSLAWKCEYLNLSRRYLKNFYVILRVEIMLAVASYHILKKIEE